MLAIVFKVSALGLQKDTCSGLLCEVRAVDETIPSDGIKHYF